MGERTGSAWEYGTRWEYVQAVQAVCWSTYGSTYRQCVGAVCGSIYRQCVVVHVRTGSVCTRTGSGRTYRQCVGVRRVRTGSVREYVEAVCGSTYRQCVGVRRVRRGSVCEACTYRYCVGDGAGAGRGLKQSHDRLLSQSRHVER